MVATSGTERKASEGVYMGLPWAPTSRPPTLLTMTYSTVPRPSLALGGGGEGGGGEGGGGEGEGGGGDGEGGGGHAPALQFWYRVPGQLSPPFLGERLTLTVEYWVPAPQTPLRGAQELHAFQL